jgi:hypothetical protein
LQFLTPEENIERSNNRPCVIWEIGKEDAEIDRLQLQPMRWDIIVRSRCTTFLTINIKNGALNICRIILFNFIIFVILS